MKGGVTCLRCGIWSGVDLEICPKCHGLIQEGDQLTQAIEAENARRQATRASNRPEGGSR